MIYPKKITCRFVVKTYYFLKWLEVKFLFYVAIEGRSYENK